MCADVSPSVDGSQVSCLVSEPPSGGKIRRVSLARARKLYAIARTLELRLPEGSDRDTMREIALVALDLAAEARAGR